MRGVVAAVALAALLLLAAAVVLGIVPGVRGRYRNADPALATAYRAKDACSCLFVMERDERHCRAWTRVSPDVANLTVDRARKTVTSRALGLWSARARWVDERSGCVLEDGPGAPPSPREAETRAAAPELRSRRDDAERTDARTWPGAAP